MAAAAALRALPFHSYQENIEVALSKTGATIYYGDKSFQRIKGGGIYGNYLCP